MKTASVKQIKGELGNRSQNELIDLCLRMAKFKKENKELLTYLLYESGNEAAYIEGVKAEVVEGFNEINRSSYYFIKKSVRKILRLVQKYIRYSKKKETEVELLIFFCEQMRQMKPGIEGHPVLHNLFLRQIDSIGKKLPALHEDLQYDYQQELAALLGED